MICFLMRIKKNRKRAGVDIIRPIYYSAEYDYNIDKLLDLFIDNMPTAKRDIKV